MVKSSMMTTSESFFANPTFDVSGRFRTRLPISPKAARRVVTPAAAAVIVFFVAIAASGANLVVTLSFNDAILRTS
uniref:Uncharacterized protein n=1 Tax=Romanomermis culicivorax TaxID=13658 RepID=A0A915IB19_ROMCU